jgi:hypothetical protein
VIAAGVCVNFFMPHLASVVTGILAWTPFLQPMPGGWRDSVWPWFMLPLCLAVSVVYKSIKCESMRHVPRQAVEITVWIILGMGGAAALLAILVRSVEYFHG